MVKHSILEHKSAAGREEVDGRSTVFRASAYARSPGPLPGTAAISLTCLRGAGCDKPRFIRVECSAGSCSRCICARMHMVAKDGCYSGSVPFDGARFCGIQGRDAGRFPI